MHSVSVQIGTEAHQFVTASFELNEIYHGERYEEQLVLRQVQVLQAAVLKFFFKLPHKESETLWRKNKAKTLLKRTYTC